MMLAFYYNSKQLSAFCQRVDNSYSKKKLAHSKILSRFRTHWPYVFNIDEQKRSEYKIYKTANVEHF